MRGIYRFERRAAAEGTAGRRFAAAGEPARELAGGRVLLRAAAAEVEVASAAGIECVLAGRLYEPERISRELGVEARGEAELLALAYRRHGREMLARLRGRFSFLLWDGAAACGLLGTDLLATRPVFVARSADSLAFADELPDLLAMLPTGASPDPVGFLGWLGGWTVPADRTLYEGVGRIAPGTVVELGRGAATAEYWRPAYRGSADGSPGELAEGLLDALERAVRRRSVGGDGVILSGGLDSSAVTAVVARVNPNGGAPRAYSAVFPGAEYDEERKIRSVAGALGIESNRFRLAPRGALWTHLAHVRRWSLPLMGAGGVIDAEVVRRAGEDGVGTVFDGQTGDEVFGFSPWVIGDRLRRGRLLAALDLGRKWAGRPLTLRERRDLLRQWGVRGGAPRFVHGLARRRRDPGDVAPAWMRPEVAGRFAALVDRWDWKAVGEGPLWWRYQSDLLVNAPHRELRLDYLRNRAAAVGLRSETPLYDVDLIDYCLRLPPELTVDERFSRPLARKAMEGLLPDEVRLDGKKANFSSYCFETLRDGDAPGLARLLDRGGRELSAYADPAAVARLWQEGARHRRPSAATGGWGTSVWCLAAAESWLRSLADPDFAATEMARADVLEPGVERVA